MRLSGPTYRVLEGGEGLQRVKRDWEGLQSRAGVHVFQTYAFAQLWHQHVGTRVGALPLVVTLEEDAEVVALFPACVVPYGPVRLLTWLGGPHLMDYGDVLCDRAAQTSPDEFAGTALRLLRDRTTAAFLYLTNVRDDASAASRLRTTLRPYKRGVAPYLPIGDDFDAYVSSLSGNHRHNVRKALRRLREAGELEFGLLSGDDPEAVRVTHLLLDLKRRRYGALRRGHDDFRIAQVRCEGHTAVARLTLDGTLIAADLVTTYRDRMYSLSPTFDEAYAAYAPGKVLFYHLIRRCFEQGPSVFDFAWGDEPYKYQWTDAEMPLTTFVSDDVQGRLLSSAALARGRLHREGARGRQTARAAR